jgi:hypothetical protein
VLPVGAGTRQFSPSKNLPIGKRGHHVGNIHYRHLRGYRLEVKTAGSGVSSQSSCAVNFSFFSDGTARRPAIPKCSGCPLGKGFGRVGGRFLHRGKPRRDTDVGPANPVSLSRAFKNRGHVGGGRCRSIVRKLETAERATALGSRLENVDVTFLLLRRARLSSSKRGMIVIVGSTDFGRL